ncbi:uncharacterized protein BYT42DRAFT_571661 [Radiomyces spectabilis]|uniref:uncharacterized protein n=1 Tax=Radiomyces spectabilis TaxID=64574 RepID=UPI0022210586|nr:uncharacterized protein BYT42DRAFT_571661 [Radiomyces spectabilis]KAI8377778.1 hypothetical protein BYT42DRAFT_571661 [Radiomyces spectabilis]
MYAAILLLFGLLQLALAGTVSIQQPKPNNVWQVGQTVTIKWKLDKSAHYANVSIALASGPAQALVIDRVIAANVNASCGHYNWTIPKSVKPANNYVVEIGPHSSDLAFAGFISIKPAQSKKSCHRSHKKSQHKKDTKKLTPTPTKKHSTTHHKSSTHCHSSHTHQPSVCEAVPDSEKRAGSASIRCRPMPTKPAKKSHRAKAQNKSSKSSSSSKPAAHHANSTTVTTTTTHTSESGYII